MMHLGNGDMENCRDSLCLVYNAFLVTWL